MGFRGHSVPELSKTNWATTREQILVSTNNTGDGRAIQDTNRTLVSSPVTAIFECRAMRTMETRLWHAINNLAAMAQAI